MLIIDPIRTAFTSAETRQIFNEIFPIYDVEAVEKLLKKSTPLPGRDKSSMSFASFFDILEAALSFRVGRVIPDCTVFSEIVSDFLDLIAITWQYGNIAEQGTRNTVDYCLKEIEGFYPDSMINLLREVYILTIDEVTVCVQSIFLSDNSILQMN